MSASAVDVVPVFGARFGGNLANRVEPAAGAPSSFSIGSSEAYGGIIDVPLSGGLRAVELYVSHQPTTLEGGDFLAPPVGDLTVDVLHLGLVDSWPADDPRLSWLLVGAAGATEFAGRGQRDTRFSLGIGGGVRWMANEHVGLRGDLRAIVTFANGGHAAIVCSGGCAGVYEGTVVVQGEVTLGVVVRF